MKESKIRQKSDIFVAEQITTTDYDRNYRMHTGSNWASSNFEYPKTGTIQTQDYPMSKWAVVARLQSGILQPGDEALKRGALVRLRLLVSINSWS